MLSLHRFLFVCLSVSLTSSRLIDSPIRLVRIGAAADMVEVLRLRRVVGGRVGLGVLRLVANGGSGLVQVQAQRLLQLVHALLTTAAGQSSLH